VDEAWIAQGGVLRRESSVLGRQHARSLYFVNNLKKGSIIRNNDIRSIRPGFGLDPNLKGKIVGRKVNKDVEFGDRVMEATLVEEL